ncbi:hypothetical protein [Capnocytophaga canimorsus]|uniref:hypothetical protein n=1 Tax=Capnocytophaga canimorsus TaxID=28188 RepID=UPI0037D122D6
MKHTIIMSLLAAFMGLMSCEKGNKDEYPEIKVGKGSESLKEISINKLTERKIVLSGGNEKFLANVENSKLAQVTIHKDTLKIKGLFEGETFATITSHDRKAHLKINVIPQEISISQDYILLHPRDESKFVSLTGGGDIVNLDVDDPYGILNLKWNGKTNILEINALHEGEATITAVSNGVASKTLKVVVRSEGNLEKLGYYSSYSRTLSHVEPKLVVKRAGVGTWFTNSTVPYGVNDGFNQRSAVRVGEIFNPQKGQNVQVEIKSFPYPTSFSIGTGTYPVFVEEVRDTTFVIRGKGFKFVLPKPE